MPHRLTSYFNGYILFTSQQSLFPYGRPPPTPLPARNLIASDGNGHCTAQICHVEGTTMWDPVDVLQGNHAPCNTVGKTILQINEARTYVALATHLVEATRLPRHPRHLQD